MHLQINKTYCDEQQRNHHDHDYALGSRTLRPIQNHYHRVTNHQRSEETELGLVSNYEAYYPQQVRCCD